MRRLAMVCSLAMLAVCLSPVPAHAYFWEWLDSLSGPRFGGVIGELELVCPVKDDLSLSSSTLASIKTQLGVDRALHAAAEKNFNNTEARRFLGNATRYRTEAERVLGEANGLLTDDLRALDRTNNRRARLSATVVTALAWQERAAAHFAWARLLDEGKDLDPRKQPGSYEKQPGSSELERLSGDDEIVARMFPIGG